MTIKLMIADVDGTMLTRDKVLTARTTEAVARLRARGVEFTVTSGRPPRGLSAVVAALGLTAPVAAFNGGLYVRPDLTTVLAQHTIPAAVASQVLDYLLRVGLDVWVYQGSDWFLRDADAPRVARERSNVGFDPIVVGDLGAVLKSPVKMVGVSEDHALVQRCEAEIGARLGMDACAARSQPYYLDVTHPEANKGMVVRQASRLLRIPLEEIATIGDMPNDIPMLTTAGVGIAMGNADAEVQRSARHVTRSNEDEGFAWAIDTFVLASPSFTRSRLSLPGSTRACLFGLDGVVALTSGLHARAWKQLFDHYLKQRAASSGEPFVPFDPVRDTAAHFEGRNPADAVRRFIDTRGITLPEVTVRALVDRQRELLVQLLDGETVETYEGSLRYIRAVRAAGLRTGVVSSGASCAPITRAAGIAELFDTCVAEPENPYLAAAAALGVDVESVAVFEDSPALIAGARAAHFGYVVAVDRGDRGAELKRLGPDAIVPDPASLFVNGAEARPSRRRAA